MLIPNIYNTGCSCGGHKFFASSNAFSWWDTGVKVTFSFKNNYLLHILRNIKSFFFSFSRKTLKRITRIIIIIIKII